MDGTLVRSIGRPGLLASGAYHLVRPWSLCLDESEAFLFVLDYFEHQILIFTTAWKFVAAFGQHIFRNLPVLQLTKTVMCMFVMKVQTELLSSDVV